MEVEIDMSLIYNSNTTRRHPVISCGKNRSPSLIPRHYGGEQQTAVPSNRPNRSLRCKERLTMIKFYYHPSPNPAINNDITGCFDPNPDLIAFHGQHDDFDIIADAHRLVYFARQNQHQSPTDLSLIASAVNADRR